MEGSSLFSVGLSLVSNSISDLMMRGVYGPYVISVQNRCTNPRCACLNASWVFGRFSCSILRCIASLVGASGVVGEKYVK
jgi:hypothetical protein